MSLQPRWFPDPEILPWWLSQETSKDFILNMHRTEPTIRSPSGPFYSTAQELSSHSLCVSAPQVLPVIHNIPNSSNSSLSFSIILCLTVIFSWLNNYSDLLHGLLGLLLPPFNLFTLMIFILFIFNIN